MNPVEKRMNKRSSHFKLAVATAVLVLVLWVAGASTQSLWITPIIIFLLWIALQLGFAHRHRHHAA
jgi:hypothetical protein